MEDFMNLSSDRRASILVFIYLTLFLLTGRFMPRVFDVIVVSVFVALMLEPISNWIYSRTHHRIFAITFSLLLFYGFVALIVGFLVPVIYEEGRYFIDFVQKFFSNQEWKTLPYFKNSPDLKNFLENTMSSITPSLKSWLSTEITRFALSIPSTLTVVFFSIVGSIYVAYGLKDFKKVASTAFFPLSSFQKVDLFLRLSYKHMQSYIVGVTIAALFTAISMGVFLAFAGIKYSLLLGTWAFITNYIPIVGVFLEIIPIALSTLMKSTTVFIWYWIVLIVVHSAAFIIFVKAVQSQSKLNPFWMIVAILIFTQLIGPMGAFVAVPLMILLKDYWDVFIVPYWKAS
jgi:putative permease